MGGAGAGAGEGQWEDQWEGACHPMSRVLASASTHMVGPRPIFTHVHVHVDT